MKRKNKILAGILAMVMVVTCFAFVGCGKNPPSEESTLSTTSEVYGFAGVTTALLLDEKEGNSASPQSTSSTYTETNDELKSQLETTIKGSLDQYMSLFNSVIGGDKPVNVQNAESGNENYDHKMTITAQALGDATAQTYTFYFNETINGSEDKVEDTDKDEHETTLEGVMYVGGDESKCFYITGKKEIEQGELEIEFKASLIKNDTNNYVVFKQEKESENGEVEEEYAYEVYVGGQQTTSFSFELERDANGKIEVEYEHEIGTSKIAFEIEKNGNNIKIETKDFLGIELEIDVTVEIGTGENEGQVRYTYSIPPFSGVDTFTIPGDWQ